MPVPVFLLYTALGSLLWNTTFVLAGYLLGENWHLVETNVGTIQNVVIVAVGAAVAWFVLSRVRRAWRGREAPADLAGRAARAAGDRLPGWPVDGRAVGLSSSAVRLPVAAGSALIDSMSRILRCPAGCGHREMGDPVRAVGFHPPGDARCGWDVGFQGVTGGILTAESWRGPGRYISRTTEYLAFTGWWTGPGMLAAGRSLHMVPAPRAGNYAPRFPRRGPRPRGPAGHRGPFALSA